MGGDASTPRRRRPAPAPQLEDDNILEEILLRLPTRPSSLPRAAAACKRWRRLISDPHFRRRFRDHHREPPLLGVFLQRMGKGIAFHSILDPPDAIPLGIFSFWDHDDASIGDNWQLLGCRHGRVLLFNHTRLEATVWDPVTGDLRFVGVPPEFDYEEMVIGNGGVLCAAGDQGHVHGGECHTSSFQVVLIAYFSDGDEWFGCVYSLEPGEWGDLSSAAIPDIVGISAPAILSGDSLYWLSDDVECGILKFDLGSQCLTIIETPNSLDTECEYRFCVLRADDGGAGLAFFDKFQTRNMGEEGQLRWCCQMGAEEDR